MAKKYTVYTKWVGYSEIIDAKDEQEAKDFVAMGNFDITLEKCTGGDLDYGFEDEQVYKIEENEDEN